MTVHHMKIAKEAFTGLIEDQISSSGHPIYGVTAKGTRYAFKKLDSASDLDLDYDVTILPPKKYFLPPKETLLSYFPLKAESYAASFEDKGERVIIGVHPYDLTGIHVLDRAFLLDTNVDVHYAARRRSTTIIGIYPTKPFKYRFASTTEQVDPAEVADAMLCDLGDCYGIEVFTDKGSAFFSSAAETDESVAGKIIENKNKAEDGQKLPLQPSEIPPFLDEHEQSSVFETRGDKCYSCGSCTLVCPTCYCFDMQEDLDLKLERGERIRVWDGCMLEDFAKVAGGHNFRKTMADRFKHRIFKKGNYLPGKFGVFGCVGCGRCADACTADIANPVAVFEEILEEAGREAVPAAETPVMETAPIDTALEQAEQNSQLLPRTATLSCKKQMTELETYFELKCSECGTLKYRPGQFFMVSIPGIGEAPISISSSPSKNDRVEMVIRKAGAVTSAIHSLNEGDTLGLRGPFGTEFPMDDLKGKNLFFVTGGIGLVPARSAITYALENRGDYGDITIFNGALNPSMRLFTEELSEWAAMDDVLFMETVDNGDDSWTGNTGVVTTLFEKLDRAVDPASTYCIVVGPPVMYKFVILELRKLEFADDHIIVSLERHMKCGVGQCGHCQIGKTCVCQDGPVFSLDQITDLPEAI